LFRISLPRTERRARGVTLPLYPHMTDAEQDRVVDAIAAEI
jgi:dTDP-4-amino-4,6-dideoxygalactose transaminase